MFPLVLHDEIVTRKSLFQTAKVSDYYCDTHILTERERETFYINERGYI